MIQIKKIFPKMLFVAALTVLNACNPQKPSSDFSLAFNPATLNMNAGETKSSTLTITPIGGFDVNAPATVAVEGAIFGAGNDKIQAAEPVKINDTSASIAFSAGSSVPAGSYDITLKITSGTLTRSAKVTIKIGGTNTTVPNPTNLTATVISSSQINLSWNAVTGATEYLVEEKVGTAFQALGTVTTPGAEITGLSPSSSYTFRVKTKIGANSSSGVETSATTQSAGTPTSSKYGFVIVSESELPGLGMTRTASASFYSAQTNEPPTVGGFGVQSDSCIVMQAGQTQPPQPASLVSLDAGTELSLKSGSSPYTTLLKTALTGNISYNTNPATPLAAVPDNLNISIPGNAAGFPAFNNISLPAFPADFSVTTPVSGDPLALNGTITWDGGLNTNNTMSILISSSAQNAPGAICFANDDGSFTVPSNVKTAFETAGLSEAKLFMMTRNANRNETANGATLVLSVSRSKFSL